MKRTRRIEITRYRRTVTVGNHEEPIADASEEITVIETAAHEWELLLPADEVEGDGVIKIIPAHRGPGVTTKAILQLP